MNPGSHCSGFAVGILSGRRGLLGRGAKGLHTHISPASEHKEGPQTKRGPQRTEMKLCVFVTYCSCAVNVPQLVQSCDGPWWLSASMCGLWCSSCLRSCWAHVCEPYSIQNVPCA